MNRRADETRSQFQLFAQRRFLPFFFTQFLGAFNDNAFKNALIILLTFQAAGHTAELSRMLVNISAALFILPFFLFSSAAGQLGDRYEKSMLMRRIKVAEVAIMCLAAIGFTLQSVPLLMFVLFLMGTQSALFGPVKYGYLPSQLTSHELVGGNGLVSMGTFLAILTGMILGSYIMTLTQSWLWISMLVVCIATLGFVSARYIPDTPAAEPHLRINPNLFTQTWRSLRMTYSNPRVFVCILGVSWFWFLGSTYLVQLPNYTRQVLGGDESVYIFLIALFCIGVGLGAVSCERLSRHRLETGLVPLGALGLSLFGTDLYFSTPESTGAGLQSLHVFLLQDTGWRIIVDIVGIGVFGGFYIVPLLAAIQQRTRREIISRVIAGNNILNAFFMVLAALFAILILGWLEWREDELFLLTAILNLVVIGLMSWREPEFVKRLSGLLRF